MRRRLWAWTVAAAIAACLLIVYVARLHWDWLYALENAEHLRLRSVVRTSSYRLKATFDYEIARVVGCFRGTGGDRDALARQVADRLGVLDATSRWPALLDRVYLLSYRESEPAVLERFEPSGPGFTELGWSQELAPLAAFAAANTRDGAPGLGPRAGMASRVVTALPALLVPTYVTDDRPAGGARASWLVLHLDPRYLWQTFFPDLLSIFFVPPNFEAIDVLVIDAASGRVVFARPEDASDETFRHADSAFGLVDAGSDGEDLPRVGQRPPHGKEAITNWLRPPTEEDHAWFRHFYAHSYYSGYWQLFLRRRGVSFGDQAHASRVQSARTSFALLALIVVTIALIFAFARYAQRLARQQMAFVASVSHELRTPLAVLSAAGDNLADTLVDDPNQLETYGRVIQDETQRLRDMVENVLYLARRKAQVPMMARSLLDASELVREVLRRAGRQIERAAFVVETDVAVGPLWIRGNAQSLQAAILNLVSNALKYGREARWLRLSLGVADGSGRREVRIAVEDRGPGIEPAERRRLFDPFYRGRWARERQIEGSGIGLALVRDVANAHDGRITVASVPGAGSTFVLSLPLEAVPDGVPARDDERGVSR